ncbi:hypothetical protein BJ508DRAFT_303329 [Ascobolus immersus RN42]|uniref:Uncharacterized protein n=1 Tax=Ascobolus immersus RN42 TaxID=1160509 RepID=A0A3N4IJQ8_ASCIM|nr:hypothetical protein BJ508DRAFT_303329 [Ascobolus immersus RN42]
MQNPDSERPSSVNIWVQSGTNPGSGGFYQAIDPSVPARLGVAHPHGVNAADIPAGQVYVSPVIPAAAGENAAVVQQDPAVPVCGNRTLVRKTTEAFRRQLQEFRPCPIHQLLQARPSFLCETCHYAVCVYCLITITDFENSTNVYGPAEGDYAITYDTWRHPQGPRGEAHCARVLERTVQSVRAST